MKYTIWKDGVLIDTVTIADFVNKIHSGYTEENYGIGAQIMIPYTDPFDGVTYDCPFNFGTFTQYHGKLGLQTHYALPSNSIIYGSTTQKNSSSYTYQCTWENSYLYQCLNSLNNVPYYTTTSKNVVQASILNCLPTDFITSLQTISFMNTDCKFFLLTATQSCANTETKAKSGGMLTIATQADYEGEVWEYWQNKIITPQVFNTNSNSGINNRIVYSIADKNLAVNIITPTILRYKYQPAGWSAVYKYYQASFGNQGNFKYASASSSAYYQPACVIG